MKKVLAVLTSTALYGKERANIEVYNILKKNFDCSFSVITNRKANDNLKQAFADMDSIPIYAVNRGAKSFRIIKFVLTYIVGNIQMLYYLLKLKPELLIMSWELSFYDYYPALLFYKGKILYRIGDVPGIYHKLSLYKYNKYIWENYVLKRVSKVVGNSKFIINSFAAEGRDTSNDSIIYNYPPHRKKSARNETGLYVNNKTNNITFGYIGQLVEWKGVHHYVECAVNILEKKPDVLFYIAGSVHYDPQYSDRLINMIPKRWKNNIIFLDEIADVDMFFKNIDVLCVPSIYQEPLANVIGEAKAAEKPCIIYPTGGIPEMISDGIDGLVCDEVKAASLLSKMMLYVENKQLALEHGKASKASIIRLNLDWDSFESKWKNVFRELFA